MLGGAQIIKTPLKLTEQQNPKRQNITSLNGAQTQSLIAIMGQFASGILTEGQAINVISTAIGISKENFIRRNRWLRI